MPEGICCCGEVICTGAPQEGQCPVPSGSEIMPQYSHGKGNGIRRTSKSCLLAKIAEGLLVLITRLIEVITSRKLLLFISITIHRFAHGFQDKGFEGGWSHNFHLRVLSFVSRRVFWDVFAEIF